jgi:hypothetical protein
VAAGGADTTGRPARTPPFLTYKPEPVTIRQPFRNPEICHNYQVLLPIRVRLGVQNRGPIIGIETPQHFTEGFELQSYLLHDSNRPNVLDRGFGNNTS